MTEEEKMAWSVIGAVNGTSWNTDFAMTEVDDGVWESDALEFAAGAEYKCRRGAAWDVQVGADGAMGSNPANIVCDEAGTYKVRLEWDGTSSTAKVTLIPVES